MQNNEDDFDQKNMYWSKNNSIQYLMELGLTQIQAKIYFNLLLYGKAEVRNIAFWSNLPRTEVYRALNELQGNGLVDRELGSLLKFSAVPPSLGLQALIDCKFKEIRKIQESLQKFSKQFENKTEPEIDREYKITVIEGRKRIIEKIKQQHDNAKFSVDIITFLPRFLRIANECLDNYKKATERGVKYRIILGVSNETKDLPYDIHDAHKNNNTIVKKVFGPPKNVNSAIFDREQTSFSYYPGRPIIKSPLIFTNHPCLVEPAQNSFDQMWLSL